MPSTPCHKCTRLAPLFFTTKDYNRKISDVDFNYFRCEVCGLVFLDPIPDDLGRYYPKTYYEVPRSEAELAARAESLQGWKLDIVTAHAKRGRLLEIGPAYGLFSHLAKKAGFDVTAIEMDARCCEFLTQTVGIEAINSDDAASAMAALPSFDVIVLWQVIEHLANPWHLLDVIAANLAPGGFLIFDTPNPQAFQFKVLGRYWTHIDAPRHVTLLSASLMTSYLAERDLRPVTISAADRSANGFNGFGWGFSFQNFFSGQVTGKFVNLLGRILAKLLIPIERTGFRGSTYTAVFRKAAAP